MALYRQGLGQPHPHPHTKSLLASAEHKEDLDSSWGPVTVVVKEAESSELRRQPARPHETQDGKTL